MQCQPGRIVIAEAELVNADKRAARTSQGQEGTLAPVADNIRLIIRAILQSCCKHPSDDVAVGPNLKYGCS